MGDWVNVAASALHLRRTVNGWSSFEPPRYGDLATAMDGFPDARTLALARSLGSDVVVLVDRAWITPARAARLAGIGGGLRPERVFPTHVAYRVVGPAPPGPESLQVDVRIEGGRACAVLRNARPDWVPLYPARRLILATTGDGNARTARATWLPLDFAPGAEHVECLAAAAATGLSGAVEGEGDRLEFTARLGDRPVLRRATGR
jgi:hypothetical protein